MVKKRLAQHGESQNSAGSYNQVEATRSFAPIYIKEVINEFEKDISYNNTLSFKLRFIQALEIAPTFLISKIRKLRNKLEHEYIVPKENEAKETIEIAGFFINATQNTIWHNFFLIITYKMNTIKKIYILKCHILEWDY